VADPLETRYSPRVIAPNFVVLGRTVYAQVGGTKYFVDAGAPPPWNRDVAYAPETRYCLTYDTKPSLSLSGLTVWA